MATIWGAIDNLANWYILEVILLTIGANKNIYLAKKKALISLFKR